MPTGCLRGITHPQLCCLHGFKTSLVYAVLRLLRSLAGTVYCMYTRPRTFLSSLVLMRSCLARLLLSVCREAAQWAPATGLQAVRGGDLYIFPKHGSLLKPIFSQLGSFLIRGLLWHLPNRIFLMHENMALS